MIPIGNQFGFIGGVSWLVILLTIVFLFFILITVCAKKDSWVRALAYTAVSRTRPAPPQRGLPALPAAPRRAISACTCLRPRLLPCLSPDGSIGSIHALEASTLARRCLAAVHDHRVLTG